MERGCGGGRRDEDAEGPARPGWPGGGSEKVSGMGEGLAKRRGWREGGSVPGTDGHHPDSNASAFNLELDFSLFCVWC